MLTVESRPGEPLISEALNARLRYWSEFFGIVDLTEACEHGGEAMSELDALWTQTGLSNKECLASGYGSWSEFVPLDCDSEPEERVLMILPIENKKLVARLGHISTRPAISQGFRFGRIIGEDRPTVYHQFLAAETLRTLDLTFSHGESSYLQIAVGTLRLDPHFARVAVKNEDRQIRYL